MFRFATFHLPTCTLHLLENHLIYERFSSIGDIIRLGDFNVLTKDEQTTLFNTSLTMYGKVIVEELAKSDEGSNRVGKTFWPLVGNLDLLYTMVCHNGQ